MDNGTNESRVQGLVQEIVASWNGIRVKPNAAEGTGDNTAKSQWLTMAEVFKQSRLTEFRGKKGAKKARDIANSAPNWVGAPQSSRPTLSFEHRGHNTGASTLVSSWLNDRSLALVQTFCENQPTPSPF